MQWDMLGYISPNQGLPAHSLEPLNEEHLAGGVIYRNHYEPPTVPLTMMARRIEGPPKPYYLQSLGALHESHRPVRSDRLPASNTEAGEAAFSGCIYGSCPPLWVMSLDTSRSGPAPQAAAPQMNTVTPYVGYSNDGGGSSVGAGVCPAPRPTRQTMQGVCRSYLTLGRSDPGSRHRSRSSHRALRGDQTHQKVPSRQAMRHSQPGAARDPAVQFEEDVNVLAARLLNEGADHVAVNLLCKQIFHREVSAEALMIKPIFRKHSTGMRGKYYLLLGDVKTADGSKGYCCLLCPQGHRKEYKNPQDSIRHFKKAHFGLALLCEGGWYVGVSQGEIQWRTKPASSGHRFYRQSEMNQHLKTCQVTFDGRSISSAK